MEDNNKKPLYRLGTAMERALFASGKAQYFNEYAEYHRAILRKTRSQKQADHAMTCISKMLKKKEFWMKAADYWRNKICETYRLGQSANVIFG
ncbi:MAG: hypothetical protein HUK12_10515 [Muribaculaceae bacterium]|nr:hypothetical protein [Muribaculaceae bacterium]